MSQSEFAKFEHRLQLQHERPHSTCYITGCSFMTTGVMFLQNFVHICDLFFLSWSLVPLEGQSLFSIVIILYKVPFLRKLTQFQVSIIRRQHWTGTKLAWKFVTWNQNIHFLPNTSSIWWRTNAMTNTKSAYPVHFTYFMHITHMWKEYATSRTSVHHQALALKIDAWSQQTQSAQNSVSRGKFSLLLIWNMQDIKQSMHLYVRCCTYAILPHTAIDYAIWMPFLRMPQRDLRMRREQHDDKKYS